MQFILFVDGEIIGQLEINDQDDLDRVLSNFPAVTLMTPSRAIDEGWG